MKAEIKADGTLSITPEGGTEELALKYWWKEWCNEDSAGVKLQMNFTTEYPGFKPKRRVSDYKPEDLPSHLRRQAD